MAAELLCTRWTMVLLRELVAGTTRFNDLRRGVPKMSPTLLVATAEGARGRRHRRAPRAQIREGRLRVSPDRVRQGSPRGRRGDGLLGAEMGRGPPVAQEPRSVAADVGHAAQSEPVAAARPAHGDPVSVSGTSATKRYWWLVVEPHGEVDLCWSDPGFDVDLYVSTDLRTMTSIWMGVTTVAREAGEGQLHRRPGDCRHNADLAGAQPLCGRAQARCGQKRARRPATPARAAASAWRICAAVKELLGRRGSPRPISISTMPSRRTREHTASVSLRNANWRWAISVPWRQARFPGRRQAPRAKSDREPPWLRPSGRSGWERQS